MKKSKIIIPALAMLVMSTAATVTGTVAWFTMNTTASAEGMVVAAKTNGSLIVKEAPATSASLPTVNDKATKVIFDSTSHSFYPSTHTAITNSGTGLYKVTNGQNVNFETGTKMYQSADLGLTAVGSDEGDFFFDYGLFIAGDGLDMGQQNISLSLAGTALTTMNGALSVDFYGEYVTTAARAAVSEANYKGTLNLAHKKNGSTVGTVDDFASFTIENVHIPKSGQNAAYSIRMRVYFDGALIEAPVSGNDYAVYEEQVSGTVSGSEDYLFYSAAAADGSRSIVEVAAGDSKVGLYIVDTDASALTYARSISIGTFTSETINVNITASTYTPSNP